MVVCKLWAFVRSGVEFCSNTATNVDASDFKPFGDKRSYLRPMNAKAMKVVISFVLNMKELTVIILYIERRRTNFSRHFKKKLGFWKYFAGILGRCKRIEHLTLKTQLVYQ